MSSLYVVSTPIGNLGDLTHRAVAVLSSVDRVLAEDTRRTAILFRRYGITTPLVSAHAHNEAARTEQVLGWLAEGQELALVSDAGTPLLSDPGARLVRAVVAGGHTVVPVPGASAALAALVAAGLDVERFTFWGFAPRSGKARTRFLEEVAGLGHLSVIYEAPGRLVRLLRDLAVACGGERSVVVGREITKIHESFFRGTLAGAVAYYQDTRVRGEIVVLVAAASEREKAAAPAAAVALAEQLLAGGERPSAVARAVSRATGIPRNQAYEIVHSQLAEQEGEGR